MSKLRKDLPLRATNCTQKKTIKTEGKDDRMSWIIAEKSHQCPLEHHSQHQSLQLIQFTNSNFPSSGSSSPIAGAQVNRPEHCDQQPKNSVLSNALSTPIHRSLQNYHIAHGGYYPTDGPPTGNRTRSSDPDFVQQ